MSGLIDADEFIKEMKELYKQAGWEDRDIHFSLADVISNIDMMPKENSIIHCKDCKHWDREDGTFRDFDGKEWHECICLNCFNAASGETPCTPAWFYCGNAERKDE